MFRASDPSRADHPVAVKLFKLDLPPERVHQLVAELQRLVDAGLDHPGLATPLAVGIVDVSAYLVCDVVDAQSLDLAVREYGPAPTTDALRVAAQLAGALDFAAAVSVIHGTLHPRDVLLSPTETRITGIGVARALERVGIAPPVRRPYTAPERVAGGAWDRRADVFSLAALLHELLWGRRLAGVGAQAAAILTPLPGADTARLRDTFARALADDPADRFPTALEFADALNGAFPDVTAAKPRSRPRVEPPPMLPLDEEATIVAPRAVDIGAEALRSVDVAQDFTPADVDATLQLRADEDERYRDAETAPAIVPPPVEDLPIAAPVADEPTIRVLRSEIDVPQSAIRDPHSAAETEPFTTHTPRSRWPIAATLLVGIGLGFVGGYAVGTRGRPDAPAAVAVAPQPPPRTATPASGREFTENTVAEPAKPAPAPAAPAPASAPAAAAPAAPTQSAARPQSATDSQQSAVDRGRLLVRSTPPGAEVTVDGREYGRTPAAVRDLARGAHRVRVTRDGYAPEERRVVITASRPAQSMTVALSRERATSSRGTQTALPAPATPATVGRYVGTLVVDSRPPGAKVYVDGKLMGTTPIALPEMRAGEHAVRLERDGYRRWSSSVRVVAAEQNRVTASLER